jgi:hypothetical protein
VNRGGSWNNNAINCRTADRNNNNPANNNNNTGFRSVLPPAQPQCQPAVRLTRQPSCPVPAKSEPANNAAIRPVPVSERSSPKTPGGCGVFWKFRRGELAAWLLDCAFLEKICYVLKGVLRSLFKINTVNWA